MVNLRSRSTLLTFSRIAAAFWARNKLDGSPEASGKRTGATRDTAILKNMKSWGRMVRNVDKVLSSNEEIYLMEETNVLECKACREQ
jgi:hypothetical protein